VLLATVASAHAVDVTGDWFICLDCRVDGLCHPLGGPQPETDDWAITQAGTDLSIDSTRFQSTFTGTIDPMTGAFEVPNPPNFVAFDGTATFSTIDGHYDSLFQSGTIFGARRCELPTPACDDGDPCTDDTCETAVVGTCTALPQAVCINTQNGTCVTTTSTSTSTSTTTTSLPLGHHPVTGAKLVLKRNSKGRETLTFVSKDPNVYVPAFGGPDDPTLVDTQIEVYSPPETSSLFEIVIPAGLGNPGWQTKLTPTATYLFKNSSAPSGISVVKLLKLRAGKGLKIVARATGLSMTTALGGGRTRVAAHAAQRRAPRRLRPLRRRQHPQGRAADVRRAGLARAAELSRGDAARAVTSRIRRYAGDSACCGSVSAISYHGVFDPT
jgi:hypothetical protein